jgi:MOSC domain-containing protein YiiM
MAETAQLLSVNTGRPRALDVKSGLTGHFKRPRSGAVRIGQLGLADDAIVDTDNHGGVDQAVYIYDREDLDWWQDRLGRELGAGDFGENLTVSGMPTRLVALGDRLDIGDVVLEVTSPRIPCATLARVMGDPQFPKRFLASERCGYYARVIVPGEVEAPGVFGWSRFADPRCPVTDLLPGRSRGVEHRQKLLATPLHVKARRDLEAMSL